MRFRTLVSWAVFAAVVIWLGFLVVGLGSTYFAAAELVDNAIRQADSKRKAHTSAGSQTSLEEFMADLRFIVVSAARRTDLPIDVSQQLVQAEAGGVRVQLKWNYPIVSYGDETYLAMPMSVDRFVTMR